MAEENQVTTKEVKATTKGPKEVTTKDPNKVAQGKRLQDWCRRNKELKAKKSEREVLTFSQNDI